MFIDNTLNFSSQQALTATAVSTNALDMLSDRDIGIGEPLVVVLTVDVAAGGTSPTLSIAIQVDTTSSFSSPVTVAQTGTIAGASLTLGAQFTVPVPPDSTFNRWVRLNYTVGGTSPTVTVTANLIPARFIQAAQYGTSGYTVL